MLRYPSFSDTIAADYQNVKRALENKSPPLSVAQVVNNIKTILKKLETESAWSENHKDEIRKAMKQTSAWSVVKDHGKNAIPSGEPMQSMNKITEAFESKGLFLVPCGELEGFDRTIGSHGPKWVTKVLAKPISTATEFQAARDFVKQFCNFEL